MQRLKKVSKGRAIIGLVLAVALSFGLVTACSSDPQKTSGQKQDNDSRQSNYDRLVRNQPAATMDYSPTRATKNFWIETWGEKGKLSYVYLMNGQGEVFGYFVLEGLPVSYCTGLIPPYQLVRGDASEGDQDFVVPGPSVDGTYSSGSNCSAFYGKDATSGSYIEYTVGMGINALIFDQPMPQYGAAEPLGDAKVDG